MAISPETRRRLMPPALDDEGGRRGETKYIYIYSRARRTESLGTHLYTDGLPRRAVVSRHDGGYRGAWYPASKSLYQPGNYTSFRAISSTLAEGEGGEGCCSCLGGGAHTDRARSPPSCSCILSLRPPPPSRSVLIAIRVFDA